MSRQAIASARRLGGLSIIDRQAPTSSAIMELSAGLEAQSSTLQAEIAKFIEGLRAA